MNEQDELQKRIALGFSMPLSEDVSEIKEQKADVLTDDTNFMEQQWQQIKKNYDVFGRIDKERREDRRYLMKKKISGKAIAAIIAALAVVGIAVYLIGST